ncbi:DUF413 domain-containing protein [Agarivorans sp. Alg241-V36]|uniref:DUF413 domain-containing protein n=1 Tax=Agarivorans sp. Alg241-V36 TaxID=2305992 RepID=UPI0013D5266C|nr:DUF413 domain-containing protein [Agarivorans sp. Alg241-V36]
MIIDFRFGNKRFYDDKRFKHGFRKSGDFTLLESELLSLYGETMRALDAGEMMPEGNQEQRFLLVCSQQLEPETKLERIWVKYKTLAHSRRRFHTLHSRCKSVTDNFENEDETFVVEDD